MTNLTEELVDIIEEVEEFMEKELQRVPDRNHICKTMIFNWLAKNKPDCKSMKKFKIFQSKFLDLEQAKCDFINKQTYRDLADDVTTVEVASGK
jgi:hypothetical protein